MSVVVAVPWIDSGCPWRAKAKDWTAAYWATLGVPVVYGIDDSKPVNRARARNIAANSVDAEVIFFADADMWVPSEQFWAAVAVAARTDRFVHAYTNHVKLSKATTTKLHVGQDVKLQGQNVANMSSGAIAVSRKLWEMVGGQDERFVGWGAEDRAFLFACETLAGQGERITGPSYHLWHPTAYRANTPDGKRNLALGLRYKQAAGGGSAAGLLRGVKPCEPDPAAMLQILREDGGPLSQRVGLSHV